MWTDRREKDGGDGGVDQGTARGEGVGGGPGRCGEDTSVCLDDGQEFIIAVEFEVGNIRGWSTIDDQLVEDFELLALFHGAALGAGMAVSAPYRAGEAHSEVDSHAAIAHYPVEVVFVFVEFEVGEEAETTEGEGEDGRHDPLKEPRREEYGAVAAEGQNKVELFRGCPAEVGCPVFEHVLEPGVFL